MATRKADIKKPVLVTTEFRGVFFGYLKSQDGREELTLTGARNCIYWAASVGGFMGLAKTGPNKDCRISASVPEITLYKITSVTPCEPESAKAWDDAKVYG